jgi:ubiquinone/menaquinone biosynthesis C-methylase UbiE
MASDYHSRQLSELIAEHLTVRLNECMPKTQKELAYIRDLYVTPEWTRRFAELADKQLEFEGVENVLYINAGSGDHCFAIREKIDERTALFAVCEDADVLSIAHDKAIAVRSDVDFSTIEFEDSSFDAVIADASLVAPNDVDSFLRNAIRTAKPGGSVTFFLPSAGSFGEVFSVLWEVLFNEDLGDHGHQAETMIAELFTPSQLKSFATEAGLDRVRTDTAIEIFEFDNGAAFISAPLVADFLLPHWLEGLGENEKEQVKEKLAQLIDFEDGPLTFRFSVKATVVTGKKK